MLFRDSTINDKPQPGAQMPQQPMQPMAQPKKVRRTNETTAARPFCTTLLHVFNALAWLLRLAMPSNLVALPAGVRAGAGALRRRCFAALRPKPNTKPDACPSPRVSVRPSVVAAMGDGRRRRSSWRNAGPDASRRSRRRWCRTWMGAESGWGRSHARSRGARCSWPWLGRCGRRWSRGGTQEGAHDSIAKRMCCE
jgi:hypothetical protein